MIRDEHRCVRCGKPLTAGWPGYSCHHRQSKSVGPDTLDNRIMLCGSGTNPACHAYVHAHPAEARANGWIVSKYAPDPAAVACLHYRRGWVRYSAAGDVEHAPAPA